MTDLRDVAQWRTGVFDTRSRLARVVAKADDRLISIQAERDHIDWPDDVQLNDDSWLINARWLAIDGLEQVANLRPGQALRETSSNALIAQRGPTASAQDVVTATVTLIDRPWHVLDHLERAVTHDLQALDWDPLLTGGNDYSVTGAYKVLAEAEVDVQPRVVFDTRRGPIALAAGCAIGAGSVIEGPAYVGRGSRIVPLAYLRANTVVGDDCKVGGEVSFSVINDHSNKSHAGYLGHALVGRWVNLGADTNVSNLKNTYSPVRVQLESDSKPEDTGRTFVGPVIGDYARTAIGTRLNTGSVVGTAAMVAVSGFAPKHVERMTFHTDDGVSLYDVDKLLKTVEMMASRRGQDVHNDLRERLRALSNAPSHAENDSISRAFPKARIDRAS